MRTKTWLRLAAGACALALIAAACTEESAETSTTDTTEQGTDAPATGNPDADSVVGMFAGQDWFAGTVPDEPVEATGEPIVIGHINQEDVPTGSFPEVRLGTEAAVDFINTELNGIDGRPIQLETCIADFTIEGSQACAQQMVQAGAVAVLGGIDVFSGGSIPVLEQNELPYVGGIPVNYDELQSDISFQFSGGTPGALAAFAKDAIDNDAEKVTVVFPDFGAIAVAAEDYAVAPLKENGAEVTEIRYNIVDPDLLPVITQAANSDADAILMFAADAACLTTMQTMADQGSTAQMYMVGSCADPTIVEQAGEDVDGYIFNIESPILMDTGVVDPDLYVAAIEKHGDPNLDPEGTATISFKGAMNLWVALSALGADGIDSAALMDWLRATEDEPSFDGHPYTCDGEQLRDLTATCSPQQVLLQIIDEEQTNRTGDWIDVAAFVG